MKGGLFSRLEVVSGVCFVGVTGVSNRSASRLEFDWGAVAGFCFVGVTGVTGVSNRNAFRLELESVVTVRCSMIVRLVGST